MLTHLGKFLLKEGWARAAPRFLYLVFLRRSAGWLLLGFLAQSLEKSIVCHRILVSCRERGPSSVGIILSAGIVAVFSGEVANAADLGGDAAPAAWAQRDPPKRAIGRRWLGVAAAALMAEAHAAQVVVPAAVGVAAFSLPFRAYTVALTFEGCRCPCTQ